VEPLIKLGLEEEELLNRAVRANILHSVEQLRSGSEILSDQIKNEGLHVVGAQYSLSTGKVDFL
jgi:carbonic anhydrase